MVPVEGSKVAPRLRALGQEYHPDCFQCEVHLLHLQHGHGQFFMELITEVWPDPGGRLLSSQQ